MLPCGLCQIYTLKEWKEQDIRLFAVSYNLYFLEQIVKILDL